MIRTAILTVGLLFMPNLASMADVLRIGDGFYSSTEDFIETDELLITYDLISGSNFDREDYTFHKRFFIHRESIYLQLSLTDKDTGYQNTYLDVLDGNKTPWFRFFGYEEYCGVDLLFVTIEQSPPRYGGMASPWLSTYIFRADTFEMLEEFSGTALDVARFDRRWVPEVDSYMPERYLVSCIPEGRGRRFSFGLIDRAGNGFPPWCGPDRDKCRYHPPPYMEPWTLTPP